MVKIQPAALAILGIIWLIQDLYAMEINPRSPHRESDFYFDDVSTPTNNPAPAEAPINYPHQGIPLQPALPNEGQNNNQPTVHQDAAKKMNYNNPSGKKANDNGPIPKERNVKKLLESFISLLLNLNDKEDGLIRQLKSYLGNENDEKPKDVPGQVDTLSTMSSTQPKINRTTPATTTPNDMDEDDDSLNEDDEGNYFTSGIPQATVSNIARNNKTNVTRNPSQNRPDRSQSRKPTGNNKNKPILDILQYQDEMGIIPNNEFIDDIVNSPKTTPGNEEEKTNNSTEPSETEQKPLNQSPTKNNVSNQENKNCTKSPIATEKSGDLPVTTKRNEANNDGNHSPISQTQISSEEPWNFSPYPTQSNYQIPITQETTPELLNQEKEEKAETSTAKPISSQQNIDSQIPYPYPTNKHDFYSKPSAYNPQRINYNKRPIYTYEPFLKQIFRPSTRFPLRRIISMPSKSYNHRNGFPVPKLQPQTNDVPPENVPFIPNYTTDQNTATSNYDPRNPTEKNEDKMLPDDTPSDSPLKNDSISPSDEPSKNMSLPQVKENMNNKNPCNLLLIQDNHTDDSVSKENKNINPVSTEFALPLNPTDVPKQEYSSTLETSPTENNFHNTVTPVSQNEAKNYPHKSPRMRPHHPRNRLKTTPPPSKLNNTLPMNQNPVNSTEESPSQNKLNDSDILHENEDQTMEGSPSQNQQNNTEGPLLQDDSTEITPTSETSLNNKPQNELSTSSPTNTSLPSESQQTTIAPDVSTTTQSTTLPDDSKEMHSEESDENYPSSEEDSSIESDDEEHDDTEDNEHDDAEDKEHDYTDDDTLHDHTDDDTLHDHTDDDKLHDQADEQNDYDKEVESLLGILDNIKALINNATSEVPQNSSDPIMNNSTELPQNAPDLLTDDSKKSPENSPAASADDLNKPTQNSKTPYKNYPSKSPRNMDYDNQNEKPFSLEEPPYQNILDYIYRHSNNPFFKELREEQDRIY